MTQVIHKNNKQYPAILRQIADPPAQLYYRGTLNEDIFENCLAVVGSRRMTQYGKKATDQLVGQVAAAGITIVSGFMYGVDVASHKAAVDAGGKTIAVMPCGIERIHPEHQKDVYEKIIETGGLVVSEWDGDSAPATWTFPRRNRIVAGLAKATLVVEAGLESGSLITAALAKKYARQVFAVPGPITSELSKGTSQLIQEGASLVASANDILSFFGKTQLADRKKAALSHSENPVEEEILRVLQKESIEIDWIARKTGMSVVDLGTTLSLMELQGFISQDGGKYYVN